MFIKFSKLLLVLCLFVLLFPGCAREGGFNENNGDTVSILFLGDTYFGETYQEKLDTNVLEVEGYDYSIQNFSSILKNADHVIANLETPITNMEESPHDGIKDYIHKSDPQKVPEIFKKNNILHLSLGNNHSGDFGTQGIEQTIDVLAQNDLFGFGAGLNELDASRPLIKEISVNGEKFTLAVIAAYEYVDIYDKNLSFYAMGAKGGVNMLSVDKIAKQIGDLRSEYENIFIVVYPHWGVNYKDVASNQEEFAHAMIDSGADLIIGHGAHTIQDVEKYNGKWILYGLGNFVFNSPGRYEKNNVDPYGFIVRLNIGRVRSKLLLYPIFTDNKITNYQSRFLNDTEFEGVLEKYSGEGIATGKDQFGNYFEIVL